MSNDDLIRRGDARRVVLAYASSYSAEEAETAIRALPAVQPVVKVKPLVWEKKYSPTGMPFWVSDFGHIISARNDNQFQIEKEVFALRTDAVKWADGIHAARILAALDVQPAPEHSDDAAVDRFAAAMKAKLAKAREKGRSGWDDPKVCTVEHLAGLLRDHVYKGNAGNFEDIANLAMMLHQRGADPAILQPAPDAPHEWTLRPDLQKIVAGAKHAPQWDTERDRMKPAPDVAALMEALQAIWEICCEPAETNDKNVRGWIEVTARNALAAWEARNG